jgi:hypothetical protein
MVALADAAVGAVRQERAGDRANTRAFDLGRIDKADFESGSDAWRRGWNWKSPLRNTWRCDPKAADATTQPTPQAPSSVKPSNMFTAPLPAPVTPTVQASVTSLAQSGVLTDWEEGCLAARWAIFVSRGQSLDAGIAYALGLHGLPR